MEELIEKKNHVIMLMDCYVQLLTDKQQQYLEMYYQEDFSISEIAENLDVSRNAVYDQIKRAVKALEKYENKLHLLEKHLERKALIEEIEATQNQDHDELMVYLNKIKNI